MAERPARAAAMSVAPAPAPAPASRLQHVLGVGAALRPEPDPTGVLGFKPKPSAEKKPEPPKPEPNDKELVVARFLDFFVQKQEAEKKMASVERIEDEMQKTWENVQLKIKQANSDRGEKSHRVTPNYDEAVWFAASVTAGDASSGDDLDNIKRIGIKLWGELNTLPEEQGNVVLSRLIACNWWWYRYETDPLVQMEEEAKRVYYQPEVYKELVRKLEETDAAKKYETRLRELYDIAIKAFRGQYKAPAGFRRKPRPNACEETYTKCTHVDFTFEEMMNTVKAQLLITKWGKKAMHTDKQRTPPPEAYKAAPGMLNQYTIKS